MKSRLLLSALALAAVGLAQGPALPDPGNVTLPLDEYNRLVELSGKPPQRADEPPFPYVVKSARMNLQVNGEFVSGTIVLEGEVLTKGPLKVPLVSGMMVFNAQGQGSDLPVAQENGVHSAVVLGPSEFAVTMECGLPLSIETGRASLSLPVPSAGTVQLTLSVPGDHTLVNLSPGLITSRASKDGRTVIEATMVPGQPSNIWWAARLSAPPTPVASKEVRFLSDVKTLISVNEAELTIAALAEITVVQGEPAEFEIQAPEGYELTGATGPTLTASDVQPKGIVVRVSTPAARSHQFLISLAKTGIVGKAEVPLISFRGTQRETGEVLVEAEGAIEFTIAEHGGLRRMDLKETSSYLRSLARAPLHAAYRYQKKPAEMPALALEWARFPDSSVLSAVAQSAAVTTLITSEGRSLTEVKLTLKNHSQPFLKVALPAGASILSSEVAGQKVKPVQGADGSRVPLLRPGLNAADSYTISFVFLHAGAPFLKKGGAELALPKMDIPIGLLEWEVFLPQQYRVADFKGDVLSARLFPPNWRDAAEGPSPISATPAPEGYAALEPFLPGQIGGLVTDPTGAIVPGAAVEVRHTITGATWHATADPSGRWRVSDVPSGPVEVTVTSAGFQTEHRQLFHNAGRGTHVSVTLRVGGVTETVELRSNSSSVQLEARQVERLAKQNAASQEAAASANVRDLQRRVAGVLPIAVTVPRTGSSYRFVRPLVVDEETRLLFSYRGK